jgi:hypothetical protein
LVELGEEEGEPLEEGLQVGWLLCVGIGEAEGDPDAEDEAFAEADG